MIQRISDVEKHGRPHLKHLRIAGKPAHQQFLISTGTLIGEGPCIFMPVKGRYTESQTFLRLDQSCLTLPEQVLKLFEYFLESDDAITIAPN